MHAQRKHVYSRLGNKIVRNKWNREKMKVLIANNENAA